MNVFLSNCFKIFSGLLPCFAYLLNYLPFQNHWLLFSEGFFLALGLILLVFQPAVTLTNPVVLSLYPFFIAIMIFVFSKKLLESNKILAISLMLGYLLTELHEVPCFIMMYLGFFNTTCSQQQYLSWFSPLNHLYSIVVGYLAVKTVKLEINRKVIVLSIFGFLSMCFFVFVPSEIFHSLIFNIGKRIWIFLITLTIFYRYSFIGMKDDV